MNAMACLHAVLLVVVGWLVLVRAAPESCGPRWLVGWFSFRLHAHARSVCAVTD
jgi:hypothetical protein